MRFASLMKKGLPQGSCPDGCRIDQRGDTEPTRDIEVDMMSEIDTMAGGDEPPLMETRMNISTETRMNRMMNRLSPSATTMIRMDHTHALMTFHKYHIDTSPGRKRAIVEVLSLALTIHATLEEEIFYPAMRSIDPDLVDKSIPEHGEMKRLIDELHQLRPEDRSYDATVMQLMRDVIRHVADEETMLLPDAERVLGEERLCELGAQMTRRRVQLATPHAGEIAVNTVRSYPAATLAFTGMLALGGWLAARAFTRPSASLRDIARRPRWRALTA
jgi:hemerythrin superfamily protein